jgi:hypothetical protein
MKQVSWHLKHYLPLLGIFVAGVLGFVTFAYDRNFQMAIILAMAVSYVTWGIIHHHIHRDLHLSVVLEYLVIAVLGLILVYSLLFRA